MMTLTLFKGMSPLFLSNDFQIEIKVASKQLKGGSGQLSLAIVCPLRMDNLTKLQHLTSITSLLLLKAGELFSGVFKSGQRRLLSGTGINLLYRVRSDIHL